MDALQKDSLMLLMLFCESEVCVCVYCVILCQGRGCFVLGVCHYGVEAYGMARRNSSAGMKKAGESANKTIKGFSLEVPRPAALVCQS